MKVHDHEGNIYELGQEIGHGGEGVVYHVADQPGWVAKIYREPKEKGKLLEMVSMAAEELGEVAAWPLKVLLEGEKALGFLCKKVSRGKEIHHIFHPKDRKKTAPKICWDFLIHTGVNLALSFQRVHEHGLVIGDVNDRNILVLPNGTVQFIDCDSFHLADYPCKVGMALYLPPELHEGGTATQESDQFALAVLLFQLLFMGRHPYAGSYPGRPEMSLFQAIREGYFCFSDQVELPPEALPFSIIPQKLQALFMRAFSGAARPKAEEWAAELAALKSSLTRCFKGHFYFGKACCWCRSEREFHIDYFAKRKIDGAPSPGPLPKLVIHTDPVQPTPFYLKESLAPFCVLPLVSVGFYYCPYIWPLLILACFFAEDLYSRFRAYLEYLKRKKRLKQIEGEWQKKLLSWETEASDRAYRELYNRLLLVETEAELARGLVELKRVYEQIMVARAEISQELTALAQTLRQAKEDLDF